MAGHQAGGHTYCDASADPVDRPQHNEIAVIASDPMAAFNATPLTSENLAAHSELSTRMLPYTMAEHTTCERVVVAARELGFKLTLNQTLAARLERHGGHVEAWLEEQRCARACISHPPDVGVKAETKHASTSEAHKASQMDEGLDGVGAQFSDPVPLADDGEDPQELLGKLP